MTPARAAALALLLAFPAWAAAQADPGQLPPEEVVRTAEHVKTLRGAGAFGEQFQGLVQQWQKSGQLSPEQLRQFAEKLKLDTPEGRDAARRAAERFKSQLPPGVKLPQVDPAQFPGLKPPAPVDAAGPEPAPPDPAEQPRDVPGGDPTVPLLPPDAIDPTRFPQPGPLPPGFDPARMSPAEWERRQKQFEQVMRLWEQKVGDPQKTPALQNLLREMFTGSSAIDPKAAEQLAKFLDGQAGAVGPDGLPTAGGGGVGDWAPPEFDLKLGDWKLPGVDWSAFKLGGDVSPPPAGGAWGGGWSGGGGRGSFGAAGESWWSVVLFVIVLVVAIVLWRFWPEITGQAADTPRALPGLGPWPVDPRAIADRDALVRAFEYLSVLVCGAGARVWNHVTIAAALRTVADGADAAEPLARLYALARYAPANEPFPPEALVEARAHLCRLAGVPAP